MTYRVATNRMVRHMVELECRGPGGMLATRLGDHRVSNGGDEFFAETARVKSRSDVLETKSREWGHVQSTMQT